MSEVVEVVADLVGEGACLDADGGVLLVFLVECAWTVLEEAFEGACIVYFSCVKDFEKGAFDAVATEAVEYSAVAAGLYEGGEGVFDVLGEGWAGLVHLLAELADEGFVGEAFAVFGAALHVVGTEYLAGKVLETGGDVPFAFLVELLADVVEYVFL